MSNMALAGGASTQSRGRRPLPPGAVRAVTLTEHSKGPYELVEFTRADGSTYRPRLLSWLGGQAGLLWGHGPYPPEIMREFARWETQGSYGNSAEVRLADALGEVFDGYITSPDMACRFFQSGGEACAAAARIARAETGRDTIATQGYHGAATDFAHEPGWLGYPRDSLDSHRRFEFGDSAGLRAAVYGAEDRPSIASCIMVEVPAWDDEAGISSFLRECRKKADTYGIPLIVDDVVCGFRLGLAGTCERYGIRADMVILGKAMSAVGCVSAVVGRADLVGKLADKIFYSTTFGGAPMPCTIAEKTVRFLIDEQTGIYGDENTHGHLWSLGAELKKGLNEIFDRGMQSRGLGGTSGRAIGQPERFVLDFASGDSLRREWCSKMIERGVLCDRPFFSTLVHTIEHIEKTLRAAEAVR